MGNDRLTIPIAEAAPGSVTAGDKFFAVDVEPNISTRGTLFTYQVAYEGTGAEIITITTDGSSYHTINYNNGIALPNPIFTLQVLMKVGGKFNIKCNTTIQLKEATVHLL